MDIPVIKEEDRLRDGMKLQIECVPMFKLISTPDTYSHYHDYIEIIYLHEGELDAWFNEKYYHMNQGDMAVINSNEPHRFTSLVDISRYAVIKFHPNIIGREAVYELKYIYPFVLADSSQQRIFNADFVLNSEIPKLIKLCLDETRHARIGYELICKASILNILISIFRYWEDNSIPIVTLDNNSNNAAIIQTALQYINENTANVSESDTARKCNLSYSYFSRLFKKVMGKSFNEYVNYLRINEAKRLLLTTNLSVAEIADKLGFSSPSHFVQMFKKLNDCPPKKYKDNYNNIQNSSK